MQNRTHGAPSQFRCFVAMAFDHPDTDCVYTHSISPILRRLNVSPIRIDLLEHNDDIDKRIIAEIEKADFLLADLTYARPSVYFEAGYGQRSVPVIYTARADHFRARDDDPNGNLRVHFDLQMKNIISWTDPLSTEFQKRLHARIAKVLLPMARTLKAKRDEKTKVAEFQRRSLVDKKRLLHDLCRKYFDQRDYVITDFSNPRVRSNPPKHLFSGAIDDFPNALLATKRGRQGRFHVVFIDFVNRVTRKLIRFYRYRAFGMRLYGIDIQPPERALKRVKVDHLICALNTGGFRILGEEFPDSVPGAFTNSITWVTTLRVTSGFSHKVAGVPIAVTLRLFDNPSRLANLEHELRQLSPTNRG